MRVRIKLRDMGVKKQPKVWLIVQPAKKNLKGKYLDRIGVVHPQVRKTVKRHIAMNTHRANYWLSVGATPTRGAHRMLSRFGLLPPLPSKFGSIQAYQRPEKQYETTHFWGHGKQKFTANHVALHYKQKLQEQMNLIERKRRLAAEAMATVGGAQSESAIDNDAEDTDDIDSDDPDIFERTKKFEKVLKRFNKHKEDKMLTLKGNDLRYNVYLKKLQKLSRKDLGLDIAAYKDYVNNLKEFAHINKDLNIFAAESLIVDSDLDERGILHIKDSSPTQPDIQIHLEGRERFEANQKSIHLTLAKFLRTNSGFISERDRKIVKELNENLKLYMLNDSFMCDQLSRVFNRRQKELKEMSKHKLMVEELLGDIPTDVLERANVSLKELKEIQLLIKFDQDIFAPESNIHLPNDLLVDNPYSFFVDFARLPKKIPVNVKQLLYRPERMARLKQAYNKVAVELKSEYLRRQNEKREWERNKHIRLNWHHRQPIKTEEEYALIDSICKQIEKDLRISSEEGMREINDQLTVVKAPIEEFTDIRDWSKPLITKLVEERRKTPKEQRLAMFRNDSVDEVDTTDLENWSFRGVWETDERLWKDEDKKPSQKTQIDRLNLNMRKEEKLRQNVIGKLTQKNRYEDEESLEAELNLSKMSPEERKVAKKQKIYDILREEQETIRLAASQSDSESENEEMGSEEQEELGDPFMGEDDQVRREDFMNARDKVEDISSKRVFPGFDDNPINKIVFEADIAKEQKRIFQRHRIDLAKLYFGKNGGYTLRELKRIYKIEMEENPERYTVELEENKKAAKAKETKQKQAYSAAVAEGPIFDMPEDRTAEIAELREKLDLYIPKIKAKIQSNQNYKNDLEYKRLISEIQLLEDTLEEKLSLYNAPIDEEIRAEAAKIQASQGPETAPLLPIHLRYMARQLTQILKFRKHEPAIDLVGADHTHANNKYAEHLKDPAVTLDSTITETLEDPVTEEKPEATDEKVARRPRQRRSQAAAYEEIPKLEESALDQLLGEKVVSLVNEDNSNDGDLDLSEFTIRDPEIEAQVEGMSDDYIQSQINKLKDEADKLEKKLSTMSLRERAQWDKYHPFSVRDYDEQNASLYEEYETKKILNKLMADNPTVEVHEELKKMAMIDPELEQWFQTQNERDQKIMRTMAKEMVEDGTLQIEQEELEKILDEISNKDGLDSKEIADKYFDEMWAKMMKRVKTNRPLKPEYLSKEQPDIFKMALEKDDEYRSVAIDEFILDQDNYDKWHMYQQQKIGRYPHGFRHFENFANYSQVLKDATIQDYMERVNRPVEFHEYLAIQRQYLLEEASTPEFQHRWKAEILQELHNKMGVRPEDGEKALDIDLNENIDHLQEQDNPFYNVQEFVTSDYFIAETRKIFSQRVQGALLERQNFTLVEALEETIDFWSVGKHMFHIPLANTYIPVRNTIMKKPNMLDEDVESDELGYIFNNYDKKDTTRKRLHALEQLSPLRSNRMGPGQRYLTDSIHNKDISKDKTFFKWRRLSHVKNNFSTMTRAYTPMMQDSMARTNMFGVSLPSKFFNLLSPFRRE